MNRDDARLNQFITKITWTPFPELHFINGSVIHARSVSHDGKYLRGHAAHRIIVDEAAFIKDDIVNTVIKPMLTDYDGWLILISTPRGRNYFWREYEKGLMSKNTGRHACWRFPSTSNPHISHDYIEEQRQYITDLEFRSEYLAEFIDDQTCVFRWDSIDDAMEDYEESFKREDGHLYYVGVDIAMMHDYTSITVLDATNPRRCRVKYSEHFNNKQYSYIVSRVLSIAQNFMPLKIIVDETGVGAGPTESITLTLPNSEGFTFSAPAKISLINTLCWRQCSYRKARTFGR